MREITSLQHPFVKHCVRLRSQQKERLEQQTVLVMGSAVLSELQNAVTPSQLLIGSNRKIQLEADERIQVTDEVLQKISGLPHAPDCIGLLPMPAMSSLDSCPRVLCLDQVKDPGNVGTLLRTAYAFDFTGVYLVHGSADPFGDKALRASKGAAFRLKLQQGSEGEFVEWIAQNERQTFVADMHGTPMQAALLPSKVALVLGSEVTGVSTRLKEIGQQLCLSMQHETESLNVAVAGGILMYALSQGEIK